MRELPILQFGGLACWCGIVAIQVLERNTTWLVIVMTVFLGLHLLLTGGGQRLSDR